jgi:hypothetical protein
MNFFRQLLSLRFSTPGAAAILLLLVPVASRAQATNDVAVLGAANITKSSTGHVVSGGNAGWVDNQSSGSGEGASAEYDHWWRNNGLSVAYTRTPTTSVLVPPGPVNVVWLAVPANSTFLSPNGRDVKWDLTRNEMNVLFARRFRAQRWISPRVMAGLSSILLNGGKASGWDHQFGPVIAAGNDVRLSSRLAFRCEFLANFLRASNFSDTTYSAGHTVMIEPRFGLVWKFGASARK